MAEVVVIKELNGTAPGTPTSLTGKVGRYCTMDSAEPGTSNPCKVPTADFYYSFWKHHYADVSGSGWTSIRDLYWYCDGNVATDWGLDSASGGGLFIGTMDSGDNGIAIADYIQATGTVGTTGNAIGHISNGHTSYRSQVSPTADADDYTSSSPLLIDSTVYSTSFQSNCWVTQLKVPPTASHGECSAKTFTISYTVY